MERDQRKARVALLGRIVRAVRQYRGEHQKPMAARGGIAREELSMIEGGRYALRDEHMRVSIAQCVGVEPAVVEGLLSEAQVDPNALADAFAVPRPVIEAALVVPPAKASAQGSAS